MKRILFLILLIPLCLQAQNREYTILNEDFSQATSISINPSGSIYIADISSNEIVKLDSKGKENKLIGGYGWDVSLFDEPVDVYATALEVYTADKNNNRIQYFDKDLNYLSELKAENISDSQYEFGYPTGCAISSQGDLYILDSDNSRIIKFNPDGEPILEIGGNDAGEYALSNPSNISIAPNGIIYILDEKTIIIFDSFGTGIGKITLREKAVSINLHFSKLIVTYNSSVRIFQLATPDLKSELINVNDLDDDLTDAAIHSGFLYLLTNTTLYKTKLID